LPPEPSPSTQSVCLNFRLTAAVRPVPGPGVILEEGYRLEVFHDTVKPRRVPTLAAAVSSDRLLDLFLDLLQPLGPIVDVVLVQGPNLGGPRVGRDGIDLPVLQSHCYSFAELLLDDGCMSIVVLGITKPVEVRLDAHKVITVHTADLRPFERVCRDHGVGRRPGLRLVQEGEHVHHTGPDHRRSFDRLANLLGTSEESAGEW
jgi:hypothetical protein